MVVIRRPKSVEEYRAIMDVMKSAWRMKDYTEAVPAHFIKSIDDNGGVVLVAEEDGRIVGFVLGIVGYKDGRIYHYSHMTGVVEEYKYRGIGFKLKLAQRKEVLKQGLDLITWTFDPLQGLNARFNFAKLGVVCNKFYVNYYGEIRDGINVGMPTDRFKVEWWIKSQRVLKKIKGELPPPPLNEALKVGELITETIEVAPGIRKIISTKKPVEDVVIAEIPGDLNTVREYSLDLAIEWKLKMRKVFQELFEKSYIAFEVITVKKPYRRNFYVFWREKLEKILRGDVPWS